MTITIIVLIIYAVACFVLLKREELLENSTVTVVSAILIIAAFAARYMCLDHVSQDYILFLSEWIEHYKMNGGIGALADSVGNYNIPYLTFLSIISYLNGDGLLAIKLFSIFFDILLAWGAMKITGLFRSETKFKLFAFFAVLFLPTVIADGAYWGQCDSVYVSLGIIGLFFGLSDRPWLSIAFIAASFAFKLQAVFLMPVYAVLWMRKKVRWYHFLVFPAVYFIMMSPAMLSGRPVIESLLLYTTQTESIGGGYSYNAPSLLAIVDAGRTTLAFLNTETAVSTVSKIATAVALALTLIILLFAYLNRSRLNDFNTFLTAVLLVTAIPFLLPHMHDRYFFFADILTLTLAIIDLSYLPAFICVGGASAWVYLCYYRYVQTQITGPVYIGSFAVMAGLIYLLIKYFNSFKSGYT